MRGWRDILGAGHSMSAVTYATSMVTAAGAAVVLALSAATPASADTATGVGFYPTQMDLGYVGTISNAGPGPYMRDTGPIQINLNGSSDPVWVFCVDWNHTVAAGLGYQLASNDTYNLGLVTTDSTGTLSGTGNPLSETVSGEIQTLLNLGVAAADSGTATDDALAAYQAAIWDIEYNLTQPAGTDPSLVADITADIAYATANPYGFYATAFQDPAGGNQALGTAVPEPATWALMLVGFAGLGGALRARRKTVAA